VSRRTWERHRNRTRVASVSATIFLSSEDGLASAERKQGHPSEASPRRKQEAIRLATATTLVADRYQSLPAELRLLALGLPIAKTFGPREGLAA
jgi:hypothetical protein